MSVALTESAATRNALGGERTGTPRRAMVWLLALVVTGSLLALAPGAASAWGALGHTVVCEIAFQELNDTARRSVQRLIQLDQQFRPRSFAESCTWPDYPRRRLDDHIVYVPRGFTRFTVAHCPIADTCLLSAIPKDVAVLRSSRRDAAKLAALKFLGHWVGDLHQPLHVSYKDDGGGGKIKADGPCRTSLHAVWDTCILEHHLGTEARAIVGTLMAGVTDADRTRWRATPIEAWANESLDIARRPSVAYCVQVGARCLYGAGRETYTNRQPERSITADTAYLDAHGPIVSERLKQAGVRLGHLLNQALGQ